MDRAIVDSVGSCAVVMGRTLYARRAAGDIDAILVHRIDPHEMGNNLGCQIAESAEGLARAFCKPECGTHGLMPYTFVVHKDGRIEQAIPLSCVSPHGRRWNKRAVGVACIGDFRKESPSAAQYEALLWLVGMLFSAYCESPFVGYHGRMLPAIAGHTEVPDSTSDPTKVCPGAKLSIEQLRRDVEHMREADARDALLHVGLVI